MSAHPHSDHTVTAVDELVAAGIIDPADRDRALTVMSGTDPGSTGRGRLAGEISAYVGGVLVFTAAALFVGTQWSQLTSGTRAGLVAGAAALLAAAAGAVVALAHGPRHIRSSRADARRRLAGALLVGAGTLAGWAAHIVVTQVLAHEGPGIEVFGFGVGLVVLLLGYLLSPTVVGLLAGAGAWVGLGTFLATGREWSFSYSLFSGLLLVAALALVALAESGHLHTRQTGRLTAGALAAGAAQAVYGVWDNLTPAYIALGLLAAVALAGYAAARAWPYLAVGVMTATAASTQAAFDLGEGSLGAAGALLVAGVVLLLTSLLGAAIHRRRDPARIA